MSIAVRLAITMVTIGVTLALVNVFVMRQISKAFRLSKRWTNVLTAALAIPLVATMAFRALGRRAPIGFAERVVVATSAFEAAVGIAAVLLLFAWIAKLVVRGAVRVGRGAAGEGDAHERTLVLPPRGEDEAGDRPSRAGRGETPEARDDEALAVTRRAFVEQAIVGSAMVVGGTSSTYGAIFGRHDYELATVPVPIPGLSRASDGFTIVQLSDLHLGQMVGEAEMRAAEELVRRAKGDLIVLTGDLIDHDPRYAARLGALVRRLGEIKPVVAIPGNHDYYTGVDEVLAAARDAGAKVLVNESIVMLGERGGFVLAGLDDHRGIPIGRGPNLEEAVRGARCDGPKIVLCHNPKEFLDIAGDVALQISGHTHGGQINFGLPLAEVVLKHGYIAGLYQDKGSHLYVNRGFGTAGAAVRVGSPPEVTRIVLVAS